MSSLRSNPGGLPRGRGKAAPSPGSASSEEQWHGANQAKTEKLRRNGLQRRARALGFELRHSAYGYALIDAARKQVDDRNDMTLDDVESCLAQSWTDERA